MEHVEEDDYVLIEHSSAPSPAVQSTSDLLALITRTVDNVSPLLRTVSLKVHDNPELGYHEYQAHKLLTSFLVNAGWQVTPKAYGIDTAFVAMYESGVAGPAVGFNVEYDALPGIGHACGHNLIAVASLAGAMATREVMIQKRLGGKVVLYGTPAEEGK